jgi:hypothetical protein
MRVVYKPRLRYACRALAATYGAATCLHVEGSSVDDAVVEAFFAALEPAALDVLNEVVAAQMADHARLAQHYTDQVARAQYEASLARRQYHAVDPDNRLVAAALERRWESALQSVEAACEAAEHLTCQPPTPCLTPAMQVQLRALGRTLPELWRRGCLKPEQKKDLLRSLIRRVIIRRPFADTVEAKVVWVSGAVSTLEVHPPVLRQLDLSNYEDFVERLLALGAVGSSDREIAQCLTAEGFHSARSDRVPTALVGEIRRARGHISLTEQFRTQAKLEDQWTVFGLAQELGVHRNWLYTRIRNGTLPATRHAVIGH